MARADIHVIEQVSDKGLGLVNEDLLGSANNCFWVFDGATAIRDKQIQDEACSMPRWLCAEFDKYLKVVIGNKAPDSFEEICLVFETVLRHMNRDHSDFINSLEKEEIPSMTITFIRKMPDKILVYTIGDSSLYYLSHENDVHVFRDTRIEPFSGKTIATFNKYRTHPEKDMMIKKTLSSNRLKMNNKDGYWVASLDLNWIQEGLFTEIPVSSSMSILLCSDGFDRLFSLFKAIESIDVMNSKVGLQQCVEDLRILEEKDSEGILFPRIKKSDDASAMLLWCS